MQLSDHQAVFLQDLRKLLAYLETAGFKVTCGEVMRTIEQQKIYMQTGRSKTMKSNHLIKCAADLAIFRDGKICGYEELTAAGNFWESLSPENRWGGKFKSLKDTPHFERNVAHLYA